MFRVSQNTEINVNSKSSRLVFYSLYCSTGERSFLHKRKGKIRSVDENY